MPKYAPTLILSASFLVFGVLFYMGIGHQETVRCYELQEQANDFDGFYLTNSEAEMCAGRGILINAPVK